MAENRTDLKSQGKKEGKQGLLLLAESVIRKETPEFEYQLIDCMYMRSFHSG